MKNAGSTIPLIILLIGFLFFTSGCGDKDYESGTYWLDKKKNPQQAARSFRRSLDKYPKKWKSHKMVIQALAMSENNIELQKQLMETVSLFPDSIRSEDIHVPASKLLGEDKYNRITAPIAQQHYGHLLSKKGDRTELLEKIIKVSCQMGDTIAAMDYFKRLMDAVEDGKVSNTAVQDLSFLIGSAGVEWVRLEWEVSRNPDNMDARMAQLDAGLIVGDSVSTRKGLSELISRDPDASSDIKLVRKFGNLVGSDPYNMKKLVQGWDGSLSPDGQNIVFLKELGSSKDSDPYIYKAAASGRNQTPIMKGRQQRLMSLAMPLYSPDGRWIYFYGSSNKNWSPQQNVGRFHLYRIRPRYGSVPEKLTDTDLLTVTPHFNRDGSILLVRRDVGSMRASVEIVRLDPDNRNMAEIRRIGEPVSGATFTPSGDSLIFTTDRGIFRRSFDGGAISVDFAWRGLFFPLISPDGKRLLIVNIRNQTLLIDRPTGELMFIGATAAPFGMFGRSGELLITRNFDGKRWVVKLNIDSKISSTAKFTVALSR